MKIQSVLSIEPTFPRLRKWVSHWFHPVYLLFITTLWFVLSQRYGPEVWLFLGWASYLIFIGMEYLIPFRRVWNTHLRDLKTDIFYLFCNEYVWTPIIVLFFSDPITNAAVYFRQKFSLDLWPSHWYLFFKVLLAILIIDFVSYWTHRACHHIKVLWPIHEVHHSSTSMNVMKNTILHPLEVFIETISWVVLFLFVGADLPEIMAVILYDMVTQLFNHANIELSSPWFRFYLMTQREHQLHHSTVYEEGYSNFGERTSIWDHLFGTYKPGNRICDVGPYGRIRTKTLWQQHILPLKFIVRQVMNRLRNPVRPKV